MNQKTSKHQFSEQIVRDETQAISKWWNNGPLEFLLQRNQDRYHRKGISRRRKESEQLSNQVFPMLNDDMLISLYRFAINKYFLRCQKQFVFTGFQRTPAEREFAQALESALQSLSSTKHIEIYPSLQRSSFLKADTKAVVGSHVPDFLIFGIKARGYSAIAIEIDGESHSHKYGKDHTYYDHMKEIGILVLSIPNEKAADLGFIKSALSHYPRKRSGSLDAQIRANKRMIWTKTIANHLNLQEIESHARERFGIEPNLILEANLLLQNRKCSRLIRAELKNCTRLLAMT